MGKKIWNMENNEHVLIFDKNEHLISEAIYSEEMKDYYRVSV